MATRAPLDGSTPCLQAYSLVFLNRTSGPVFALAYALIPTDVHRSDSIEVSLLRLSVTYHQDQTALSGSVELVTGMTVPAVLDHCKTPRCFTQGTA